MDPGDKSMTITLKRIAQAFFLVGFVVFAWYGQSRLFAPIRSVKIEQVSPSSETPGEPSRLTLATYNIAHGRGGRVGASNWTGNSTEQVMQHLAKIAAQVSEQKVDILVLNEVDLDSSWSKSINQAIAIAIAEEAGLSWCASQRNFDVSFPFRRYCFGNAVTTEGHNAVDTLLKSGLLKVGDPAVQDDYLTFPSANPDRAIDWILCSPNLTQSDTWVVKSDLSDHLMVVGRVTD